MMSGIAEWAKHHLKTALLSTLAGGGIIGTAGGSAITYYMTNQQNRVDRFADSLMEQYQAVADSKRELYASVDKFTASLGRGKKPDRAVVDELNLKLLDLHQRIDTFSIGLDEHDRQKLVDVKLALANMKIEAAQAKSKDDLQYFAGRLAQFELAYQAARPIVERKIGEPDPLLAG